MLGVALANDASHAISLDDFAVLANRFHACSDLHGFSSSKTDINLNKDTNFTQLGTAHFPDGLGPVQRTGHRVQAGESVVDAPPLEIADNPRRKRRILEGRGANRD